MIRRSVFHTFVPTSTPRWVVIFLFLTFVRRRVFFFFFFAPAVQVGAVDCSGSTEKFCVSQGVREFPGVALVIDGKATSFDGNTGGFIFRFFVSFCRFTLFSVPVYLQSACCHACCALAVFAVWSALRFFSARPVAFVALCGTHLGSPVT